MGLFGPKISKEKKNYWNAFSGFCKKPNQKTWNALIAADKEYRCWQTPFIEGVMLMVGGHGDFEMSYEKALDAFQRAFITASAKNKASDVEFVTEFTRYIKMPAENMYVPVGKKAENIRKLGYAAMMTFDPREDKITYDGVELMKQDDTYLWFNLFIYINTPFKVFKATWEDNKALESRNAYQRYFSQWRATDEKILLEIANDLIKGSEGFYKNVNSETRDTKHYEGESAMLCLAYSLISGHNLPLNSTWEPNESMGYARMWAAAMRGNLQALHTLMEFCNNKWDDSVIRYVESGFNIAIKGSTMEKQLSILIDRAIKYGDDAARDMLPDFQDFCISRQN